MAAFVFVIMSMSNVRAGDEGGGAVWWSHPGNIPGSASDNYWGSRSNYTLHRSSNGGASWEVSQHNRKLAWQHDYKTNHCIHHIGCDLPRRALDLV